MVSERRPRVRWGAALFGLLAVVVLSLPVFAGFGPAQGESSGGVSNPANDDLDMGGFDISNGGTITGSGLVSTGTLGVTGASTLTGGAVFPDDVGLTFSGAGSGNQIIGRSDGVTDVSLNGTPWLRFTNEFSGLVVRDTGQVSFSSSGLSNAPDVGISRSAAGLLAVNDGAGSPGSVTALSYRGTSAAAPLYRAEDADSGVQFSNSGADVNLMSNNVQALTALETVVQVNVDLDVSGKLQTTRAVDTTAGDAATLNATSGRFRKDATGATFTLTNSFVTTNSIVILTLASSDTTALSAAVTTTSSGSFVVTFNAAPTANCDVNFLVVN